MNFHGKDIKIFSGNSNVDVARELQAVSACLLARATALISQTAKLLYRFTNQFAEATALSFSQPAHR